jgi:hypothetical protein
MHDANGEPFVELTSQECTMYKAIPQDRQQDDDRVVLPPALAPILPWMTAAGIQQSAGAVAGVGRIATECLSFVCRRLSEDVRLAEQLAAARSPVEAWGRYAEFWQKAAQDYWNEYAALAKLSGEFVHARVEASRQGASGTSEPAAAPMAKAA